VNDGVVQRWRHTLSLDWTIGEVTTTLTNSYLHRSEQRNRHGAVVDKNRVKAYSLWDLTGSWSLSPDSRCAAA
jgi:iron complex outermembrane receptor protein